MAAEKVWRYTLSVLGHHPDMVRSDEGEYVDFEDYDQLRQRVAEVEEARERAYDNRDMALQAAEHEKDRAEQAEAKLALAEQDARRYRHARTLTEFRDFQESPDQLDRRLDRYIAAIDASGEGHD